MVINSDASHLYHVLRKPEPSGDLDVTEKAHYGVRKEFIDPIYDEIVERFLYFSEKMISIYLVDIKYERVFHWPANMRHYRCRRMNRSFVHS